MIKPTIGRSILFRQSDDPEIQPQPNAAIITYVWNDRMVNLTVFDASGASSGKTSVTLVQEGDERPIGYFCEWMEYQNEQAKLQEAALPK